MQRGRERGVQPAPIEELGQWVGMRQRMQHIAFAGRALRRLVQRGRTQHGDAHENQHVDGRTKLRHMHTPEIRAEMPGHKAQRDCACDKVHQPGNQEQRADAIVAAQARHRTGNAQQRG